MNTDLEWPTHVLQVTTALVETGRAEWPGVGTFEVVERPEQLGVNPQTGQAMSLAARRRVRFRSAAELRKALSRAAAPGDDFTSRLQHQSVVELKGFGTFELKKYPGYVGANPTTGEAVRVAATCGLRFQASPELKARLSMAPAFTQVADDPVELIEGL